ncbi:unnamed protein product [Paramecium primaurelia]|uniref:protein-tyrosine-phosphatase n=1 Tax=Paramecium primaurelia TaxID=5886 RepID=A0A8S1KBH9_PARPR|nr:unnamed protein product [Paramecium primaurelia]
MFDRFGLLEPYRSQSEIMRINDHSIWLGDYSAALDIVNLKVNNIKSVLSIIHSMDVKYTDINHKIIYIKDKPDIDIFQYFDVTNEFIESALQQGSLLVHCSMGISRSPAIVIAYIMMKFKYPFSKAYHIVRKKRPIICPNFGFSFQLKQYERICIQPKIMPEVVYKEFKCPPIQQVRSISLRKSPQQQFINSQAQSERQQNNTNTSLSASSERKTIHQKRKQKEKKLPQLQPQINFGSYNTIKEFAEKLKASRLIQIKYN